MYTLTSYVTHLLCQLHHLIEAGFNHLVGLLQQLNEFLGLFGVRGGKKGVRRPCILGTCSSSNTVHIVLRVVRKVKVDNKFDVSYICIVTISKEGKKGS